MVGRWELAGEDYLESHPIDHPRVDAVAFPPPSGRENKFSLHLEGSLAACQTSVFSQSLVAVENSTRFTISETRMRSRSPPPLGIDSGEDAILVAARLDTSNVGHSAFRCDGVGTTTNNVRFFFTEMDVSKTEATLVDSLIAGGEGISHTNGLVWIGGPSGCHINGLFDDICGCDIARAANDMMFSDVPEPTSIAPTALGRVSCVA